MILFSLSILYPFFNKMIEILYFLSHIRLSNIILDKILFMLLLRETFWFINSLSIFLKQKKQISTLIFLNIVLFFCSKSFHIWFHIYLFIVITTLLKRTRIPRFIRNVTISKLSFWGRSDMQCIAILQKCMGGCSHCVLLCKFLINIWVL